MKQSKELDDRPYCVYMHLNKINGKMYIGQSKNIHERWRCNGKNYFNSIKFFRAIKKYGWDNFYHIIIKDNLTKEEANKWEKDLIKNLDTIRKGYNLEKGGYTSLTEKSLKKMSESLKRGYIEHPERRLKISLKKKNTHFSKEICNKLSFRSTKAIRVIINDIQGSLRYWERLFHLNHCSFLHKKKKYGILYIEWFLNVHYYMIPKLPAV